MYQINVPKKGPSLNQERGEGIKSSRTPRRRVEFVYLPKKMKPEKQDTRLKYRASLAATPVPCSISSVEIQLRSEPISPRPFLVHGKIHEHDVHPNVLISPSMCFLHLSRTRSAIKPWQEGAKGNASSFKHRASSPEYMLRYH